MSEERELRNAVFQAQQAVQNREVDAVTTEEAAKAEFDLQIPTSEVPLPSQGRLYESGHPLQGKDRVQYRAMTAREEDILTSKNLIKNGTVVTKLIEACLIDKNINVNSLLSGDRNALMMAVRMSGYGEDYETTHSCPNCGTKNNFVVDLSGLALNTLQIEPVEPGQNRFSFVLPMCKKEVHFKFLTGKEEEVLIKNADARKKKGIAADNLVTSALLAKIVSVDGNENRALISRFVQVMPARDSVALRKYIDDHEPGVNMDIDFECDNCGHEDVIQMPLGATFFWPNANK